MVLGKGAQCFCVIQLVVRCACLLCMAEVFFASVLVFIVFVCDAIVDAFCMCVMQPMHSVGANVGRSRGRRPLVRALSPC